VRDVLVTFAGVAVVSAVPGVATVVCVGADESAVTVTAVVPETVMPLPATTDVTVPPLLADARRLTILALA
jgi:hypothetical protein